MVESPTQYEAPVESVDVSPAADKQLLPLESQVSLISSVQLSPNRVREDFTYDTLDVLPVFQVSQETMNIFPIRPRSRHGKPRAYRAHRSHRLTVLC